MGRVLLMLIVVVWIGWTIYATVGFFSLKRLIAGSENPLFLLSRHDRRERARKLLQRQDDEYSQQLIEKTMRHLQEGN